MALVPLSSSRVVCLYNEEVVASGDEEAHGGRGVAALLQLLEGGALALMGKYHFSEMAVSGVHAVPMSPTSFLVGFSGLPAEGAAASSSKDLGAVWMEMQDEMLVADPHPVFLEPESPGMRPRDLALVSKDMVAYVYQSIAEHRTKVAILRVDPVTHRITVTGGPESLRAGDAMSLGAVQAPDGAAEAAHVMVYFQSQGKHGSAETCRVSPAGRVTDCRLREWADHSLGAVGAGRLRSGGVAFVFAKQDGDLYYQLVNPQEAGEQM